MWIEGNYVDGVCNAVYLDTGGSTNIIIAHNTFKNCLAGVVGSRRSNTTIIYLIYALTDRVFLVPWHFLFGMTLRLIASPSSHYGTPLVFVFRKPTRLL